MLCLAEDSSQDVRRDEDGTIGKNPPIITCLFDVGEHVISEAILNSTASRETTWSGVPRRRQKPGGVAKSDGRPRSRLVGCHRHRDGYMLPVIIDSE